MCPLSNKYSGSWRGSEMRPVSIPASVSSELGHTFPVGFHRPPKFSCSDFDISPYLSTNITGARSSSPGKLGHSSVESRGGWYRSLWVHWHPDLVPFVRLKKGDSHCSNSVSSGFITSCWCTKLPFKSNLKQYNKARNSGACQQSHHSRAWGWRITLNLTSV